MAIKDLKVCSWNIHGYKSRQIGNKLHSEDFLNIIKDQDIISLTETHIHDEILEHLSIPGYKRICHKNRVKNEKSRTAAGGIAIFVKECLEKSFSNVYSDNEDTIWVTLKNDASNNASRKIFLASLYISPTARNTEKAQKLLETIASFQAKGEVLISGDFNARTSNKNDIIAPDKFDDELEIEIEGKYMERNSQDKTINKRGEDLLDLCKSLDLRIANGRKIGDPFGNYTCLKWNGNSVVDYLLTSNDIFDHVPTFKVGDYYPLLSDHCPLFYNLEVPQDSVDIKKETLKEIPKTFRWSETETAKFLANLQSEGNQQKLTSILDLDFNDTNKVVDSITNLLLQIAETANIKQSPTYKTDHHMNPPWFDKNCSKLKKEINILAKKIKKSPKKSEDQKNLLTKLKKSFKATVKKSKLLYKDQILQKMHWSNKRTKEFWKLVGKLEHKPSDKKFITGISGQNWKTHFKNLLQNPRLSKCNILPQNTSTVGPLDAKITKEEIDLGAYVLRHGKSAGIDNISYEMISCLLKAKPDIIVTLFNSILKNPVVIHRWNTSMISPIHKGGSKSDPDNYRGISLLSCFSKYFCSILNQRLLNYVTKMKILSEGQLGFVPGNRTSDGLFILHNLINHYCQKNSKHLFGCFVDFSKAFDTIPREKLFQKLLDYNINGKFYDCLSMLYNRDQVCVKIDNKTTECFQANRGVKQGCILSPLLFNIFLSDLQSQIEQPDNSPAFISQNKQLGCLMWADDLLLLSQTDVGLNKMLETLNKYTTSNGLKINIDKTKVMVFNKTGRHIRKHFVLGTTTIETTREYKYLGFKVAPHGGIANGLCDLKDRALKAFYKMKHQMGTSFRRHPAITVKLFKTLIQPILLYASDFWGALKLPKNNPIEALFMKFCKELLGVQKQTTNIGVLLELGETPLSLTGTRNAIKNWVRISKDTTCNELVKISYANCITNNLLWSNKIKETLSGIGMLNKFLNKDDNTHIAAFQRLTDIFHQNTFHEINNEASKLRTYSLFKTQIGYEKYLSQIENIKHRTALTKLRLSNHSLEIEKGRHQRKNKNMRFCPFCPESIEDEKHFLLQCGTYTTLRYDLISWTESQTKNFSKWDPSRKFISLMTTPLYMKKTASFVFKMFAIREFLLKKHKNTT